jgi:succinoglycan biosynthesis transport protein ExoP
MNELSPWRIHRLVRNEESQPEFSHVSEPVEISISTYWNILVRNRTIILILFLLVFTPAVWAALSATPLYTATARIKIEPQNPRVTGLEELLTTGGQYDYHQTQFTLLRSRPLAARVITELDLEKNETFTDATIVSPDPVNLVKSWIMLPLRFFSSSLASLFEYLTSFFGSESITETSNSTQSTEASAKPKPPLATPARPEPELSVSPWLIDKYLGFLGVAPISQTRLVNVQFTTPDPALSQALANAHIQGFMRTSLEDRFSLTQEAREFLDQKKNELQQKLESSEAELNRFRRAHGVLSVEKGENIVVDRLVDLNKQLTAARALRIEAESLYRTVENRNYQDLAEVMKQGLVQQLKGNLANLEADHARSATTFKPDHPRIQQLSQQIAAARQALNNEVTNVVRGIRSNYAAALEKERALESEADKQQRDALKLRQVGVQYTVLQEEVNANRTLYGSVLKRLSETYASSDLAVSNMQIVERAAKPLLPSGPNSQFYLLAGAVSGLFLGVGVAFLREFFDSTAGTPDEVWHSVGLGTLGVVPHVKFLNRPTYRERLIGERKQASRPRESGVPALVTNHGSLSIMNEAYRTIRTSLLLSQADKPPQVILLTSPSPGEGKTVTSLNLAIALVRDGHTVLLVDADMREGRCHDQLGLTNHRGLSNVLTGGLSLDEGIQGTPISGLSLLSRGVPPPNPSELLGSRKMKEILKDLRQRFEFILIDSPPVIAISDAAILSVITDGVILVFDGQRTSTGSAQKAVERLDTVRARFLGVVLNGVNLHDPYYAYYRAYSHYYHQDSNENGDRNTLRAKTKAGEMKNRLARSIRHYFHKGFHPEVQGNGENARQDRAEDWVTRLDNKSPSETKGDARLPTAGSGPMPSGKLAGTVSQAFLSRLMDLFMESVGPIAPLIVRDHIGLLGESPDAFPTARVEELVKSIEPEILHPEIKLRFQKKIAEEIRNLETTV